MDKNTITYTELKKNLSERAGIYLTHPRRDNFVVMWSYDNPDSSMMRITKDKLNFLISESENLESLIESIRLELLFFGGA